MLSRLYIALRYVFADNQLLEVNELFIKRFGDAMFDNFNIPVAILVLLDHANMSSIKRVRRFLTQELNNLAGF